MSQRRRTNGGPDPTATPRARGARRRPAVVVRAPDGSVVDRPTRDPAATRRVRGAWKTPAVVVRAPDGSVVDRPTRPARRTGATATGAASYARTTAKAPPRRGSPPPGVPGGVLAVPTSVGSAPRTLDSRGGGNGRPGRSAISSTSAGGPVPAGDRGPRLLRLASSLHLDKLSPIDDEARERRNARLRWLGTRVGSVALSGLLVYAVFPVRTYLNQRSDTDRAREQLEVIRPENDRLEQYTDELREPETIEEIARRDYGLVMPGEESYGILPPPEEAPTDQTDGAESGG